MNEGSNGAVGDAPWLEAVPRHWTVAPVYARCEVQLGKMLDGKRIVGDHLAPYLRNVDIQWGKINTQDLPQMDFSEADRQRFSLRAGDLLVCEGGEIGRCAVWPGNGDECYYQKALLRVRPRGDGDHTDFLYYAMYAAAHQGVFDARADLSTIAHLPAEKLRRYRLPFPPADEQRAIVRFLDRETARIDVLIEKKRRQIELLHEKRAALISHAVTKGLDPNAPMKDSGIDWLGPIPAHWTTKRIKHVAEIRGGQVDPTIAEYSAMPLIAPNHIEGRTGRLIAEETADDQGAISGKYLFKSDDVLYSKIRPALAKACIAPFDGLCSADMYAMVPKPGLNAQYVLYLLLSDVFTKLAVDESMRVAMPKINREDLGELRLPIAPEADQACIVEYLATRTSAIDGVRMKINLSIDRLREYRTALISAAVTGKIDVRQEVA